MWASLFLLGLAVRLRILSTHRGKVFDAGSESTRLDLSKGSCRSPHPGEGRDARGPPGRHFALWEGSFLLSLQPRSRSRSHDLLLCCPCSRCIELIDADSRRLPRRLPGNEGRVLSTSSRRVLEVMPSCDFGGLEGMWKVVTCGSRHVQPACSDSCYVCVCLPYRVAASGRPPVRAIASDVSVS